MPKDTESISIVYEEKDDRPTLAATGAYGGPTPDGSAVVAHLYLEHRTIPSIAEHEVGEGGVVDLRKGNEIRRGDVTRSVMATLVLTPEAAIRLGQFLVEKGKLSLQARAQNPAI